MIKPVELDESDERTDVSGVTTTFFGSDTPLRRAAELGGRPYEERPQQREMAEAIAAAFDDGRHVCIEAPTGVGKTFAYLVPSIHLAHQVDMPVVISTHTISLQEQIIQRDLPILANLMGVECRYAIAKGRSNYVCLRRLGACVENDQAYLPSPDLVPELARIREWVQSTDDGSRSSLDFEPSPTVWDSVCCEIGNCLNAKCPLCDRCFLMKARKRLMSARIIVANHALFFSDLGMKLSGTEVGGILPEYCAVVLDEGHCVEDTAAVHLGLRATNYGVRRSLRRLYNAETNRGLLVDVAYTPERLGVIEVQEKAEGFFKRLAEWLDQQNENPLRYTAAGHVPDFLGGPLEETKEQLRRLIREEKDDGRRQELIAVADQISAFRDTIHAILEMTLEKHVYWFDRFGPGQKGISMNAVPVEVGELLAEGLFNQDFRVVVTSATLAVRGKMEYFRQRIGMHDGDSLILSSPFDFQRQVKLFIPEDMPNPNDTERFIPAACDQIRHFLEVTHGKAFVLFTSYRMMDQVAEELQPFFEQCGIRLFIQGQGMPRSRMLEAFRQDINSVIFGTSSFWTGVDVPGEALSNVMIVRLPFAVPDHPLIAARQETVEREGKNAFWEYSLPEAVLKFRQGVGRLIRSQTDTGIIVVLDNRILRARYGRTFIESIPACAMETV
jgi:ATP-dependent DNA helicase DinG